MHFIDTHCHIDFPVFDANREAILQRAKNMGVQQIVVPGVTAQHWPRLLQCVASQNGLHAALGLHPCFMAEHTEADLAALADAVSRYAPCAIGEIGLDLFIANADLDQQLALLRPQLQLAKQNDLPVLLHVRKAHDQMLKVLRQLQLPAGGCVHAFSGSEQQAEQYLKLGFKLGIGGTLTYERASKLRRLVRQHPLSCFVLETDAPDIPLAAHRGEINRPERVAEVAAVMAEIKECSIEEVAALTTASAQQVFRNLD